MEKNIQVSVLCMVYNHEKFLRKCLESLVNQKTKFDYEILIHDDASTDSSKQIIEEFSKKYPNKIIAVFEKENQYSQKKNINTKIMFPKSSGRYIAFCEGDDCWCDENKLQKQFDVLEKNKDASMCVHNTIIHDLSNKTNDKLFNDWNNYKELSIEEVFIGWNVHTTSFFIRRDAFMLPEFALKYWFGDFIRLTIAYSRGKIIYLPDVMSIYNSNNPNGIVNITERSKNISKLKARKDYLVEYNEYTNNKYKDIIKNRLEEIDFLLLLTKEIDCYKEFKCLKNELKESIYYRNYRSKLNITKKIIFEMKYNFYIVFRLIQFFKKVRSKKIWIKKF